jgi:cell division GTPase FtsZ
MFDKFFIQGNIIMTRRDLLKILAGLYGLTNIGLFARELKISKEHTKPFLKKQCIIGIGGGGTNIVENISHIDNRHKYIHINSDLQSLKRKSSKHKILLGHDKKGGLGCGGNVSCGRSLVDNNTKQHICNLTKKYQTVYVISTLGGGVGSGTTPEVVKYLNSIDKKIIVLLVKPFIFEGKNRTLSADTAITKIQKYTKNTFIFSNDALVKNNKTNSKGFGSLLKLTSQTIYQTIVKTL